MLKLNFKSETLIDTKRKKPMTMIPSAASTSKSPPATLFSTAHTHLHAQQSILTSSHASDIVKILEICSHISITYPS